MRAAALLLAETPAVALLGVVRERRSSQTHSVVYKDDALSPSAKNTVGYAGWGQGGAKSEAF